MKKKNCFLKIEKVVNEMLMDLDIRDKTIDKGKLNFSLFSKLRDQNIFLLYNTFPSYGII